MRSSVVVLSSSGGCWSRLLGSVTARLGGAYHGPGPVYQARRRGLGTGPSLGRGTQDISNMCEASPEPARGSNSNPTRLLPRNP